MFLPQRRAWRVASISALTLLAGTAGVWAQASGTDSSTLQESVSVGGTDANGFFGSVSASENTFYTPPGPPTTVANVHARANGFDPLTGTPCLFGVGSGDTDSRGTVDVSMTATAGTVHAVVPGVIIIRSPFAVTPATVTIDAMGKADAPQQPTTETSTFPNPDGTTTTITTTSATNPVTGGRIRIDAEPDLPGSIGCSIDADASSGDLTEIQQDTHVQ